MSEVAVDRMVDRTTSVVSWKPPALAGGRFMNYGHQNRAWLHNRAYSWCRDVFDYASLVDSSG